MLEKKNKELTEKNTKLLNDNRALKKMLDERAQSEGLDEEAVIGRCSRLYRLVGDGIYTVTKRNAPINSTEDMVNETQQQTFPDVMPQFDGFSYVSLPFNYF